MKTPRKAVVSKRVPEDEKLNSARWTFFLSQCAIEWDSLTDNSKDFFCGMGHQEYTDVELNSLIDKAMGKLSGKD